MNWPGQRLLQLKINCKVMLIWNKSDDLKNGTMGKFVGMRSLDAVLVSFDGLGVVEIK